VQVRWQLVGLELCSYSTSDPVSTWMGGRLRAGKPCRYVVSHLVNSAFHPSGVGKSSTSLPG